MVRIALAGLHRSGSDAEEIGADDEIGVL